MGFFRKISSFFAKKRFARGGAGKKGFVAQKVKKTPKRIIDIDDESYQASGKHGKAFNLRVLKGKHEARLVIKKYHGGNQSMKAEREFGLFQKLKRLGLAVPPTIRLVEINGKKYVALTDLSKFGWIQTKEIDDVYSILDKKSADAMMKYIENQEERAAKAGIALDDCWEIMFNPEKKTAKAFILDLEWCRDNSKQ